MKGDTERERYLNARQAFAEQAGLRAVFDVADHWPLYAGLRNIRRYLFIVSLLDRVKNIPGDVAEFGCWRGATTSLMAKWLAQSNKRVHAFDHFQGFDQATVQATGIRSDYKGNLAELKAMLAVDGLEDAVEFHVGDIVETVKTLAGTPPELSFSFAYIDCDVYEPCIAALVYLRSRLMPGGLIVFDEWNDPAWPGETKAVQQFLDKCGDEFRVEGTPVPQPSLVLVKR